MCKSKLFYPLHSGVCPFTNVYTYSTMQLLRICNRFCLCEWQFFVIMIKYQKTSLIKISLTHCKKKRKEKCQKRKNSNLSHRKGIRSHINHLKQFAFVISLLSFTKTQYKTTLTHCISSNINHTNETNHRIGI